MRSAGRAETVAAEPRAEGRAVRVCVVAPSLDILGGQAVQAMRLLDGLAELPSLDVRFVPMNPRLPGVLRALQRVKYVRTVATTAALVATLLRELRRCDVVHAFSASYWSFIVSTLPALLVGRLYGRRVVLNYHSGLADDHLTRWRRTAVPLMRLADEIIVPSGFLVDVFARHGLPARAIFNHIDAEAIPYRERGRVRPVFLSNRNFEPHYNVACVMRAFATIQRRTPSARLIVVGDGSERANLERLAADLGLRDVEFTGQLPPAVMSRRYDEADVYLNAPDADNMPLSVIEAFAAGLPVVTTRAGGIPYIVTHGETGLMVECGDADGLAAAALRLLDEPGLARRLALRARAECLARYVWPAVRREWEQLYLGLARRARTAPAGAALAEGRGG